MLQRRTFLSELGRAAVVLAAASTVPAAWAQRPTHPIARPPRPAGPLLPGRFAADGVASGTVPGVYVVVDVDAKADTLRLRDQGGRTGLVHVNADMFELESLKPGDEVEVDFMVPDPGSQRLEAGGLWEVQR